ncbi:MAG: ribosome biogenesis GTPase YlqF [Firmicutes bacterium]|jgi:ribosome biogenesis GTPase A|nr:ribosome biogenesis GTPase YlqF [Bacillota bacterium]NLO65385.1 ribosome biogenesis GTPase YlqF [Bacillota bacterium]
MTIQWYPGHMHKARRMIEAELKLVDGVVEVVDARLPLSSRNPDLQDLTDKPRFLVLAKADLADPAVTEQWVKYWASQGISAIPANLVSGSGLQELRREINGAFPNLKRLPRLLIVGIPNVGKSTLINRLTGRRSARVGARPGITRGKQWLTAKGMQLLDSPGILWPKFDDQEAARKLVAVAAVRDEVVDGVEIAAWLLSYLMDRYPEAVLERYGTFTGDEHPLEEVGRKRGCLLRGGIVDLNQAAALVLKDFRSGRFGSITLEEPPLEG